MSDQQHHWSGYPLDETLSSTYLDSGSDSSSDWESENHLQRVETAKETCALMKIHFLKMQNYCKEKGYKEVKIPYHAWIPEEEEQKQPPLQNSKEKTPPVGIEQEDKRSRQTSDGAAQTTNAQTADTPTKEALRAQWAAI